MREVRVFHWFLCALVLTSTIAGAQNVANPAGTWVLQLGNRQLLVLSLKPKDGGFSGTLSRPEHFQTGDGRSFSHIQGPVQTEKVIASAWEGGSLRFTVQNSSDPKDTDSYLLTITDPMHAKLSFKGVPLPPMALSRVTEPATVAVDWDPAKMYSPDDNTASNPEMKRIFDEDQSVRQQPSGKINWSVVNRSDAERRTETKGLLDSGALHSGTDFVEAAFVFQHGDTPNDYLLAHTLALVALAKGQSDGLWIAAATLDRYLQSVGKPQIYGTQFRTPPGQPTTQDPYDRALISDAVRQQLGVPPLAAQEKQLQKYSNERTPKE